MWKWLVLLWALVLLAVTIPQIDRPTDAAKPPDVVVRRAQAPAVIIPAAGTPVAVDLPFMWNTHPDQPYYLTGRPGGIVVRSLSGAQIDFYAVDLRDRGIRSVTWSPDHRYIAYLLQAMGPTSTVRDSLGIIDTHTNRRIDIQPADADVRRFLWGSDSASIIYAVVTDATEGDFYYYRYRLASATTDFVARIARRIITDQGWDGMSPTGEHYAYNSNTEDVLTIEPLASEAVTSEAITSEAITSEDGAAADAAEIAMPLLGVAAWSPDGGQLAFQGRDGLLVIDADGQQMRRLTTHDPNQTTAAHMLKWSSDGRWLLYYVRTAITTCPSAGVGIVRVRVADGATIGPNPTCIDGTLLDLFWLNAPTSPMQVGLWIVVSVVSMAVVVVLGLRQSFVRAAASSRC